MKTECLDLLPDCLRRLVLETEKAIGFEVEVIDDPSHAKSLPGAANPMACKVGKDFARMLVGTTDQFRPCSVFHELLHIRRFLVERIPKLVDCADYEPWAPEIGTALANQDNAFEHLVIVPRELQAFPERREYWEAVMVRALENIEAGIADEVARRQLGLASWAFLKRVLPDSAAMPRAREVLEASNNLEYAERFCEELFPLLEDKAAAIRVWLKFMGVPLEMASLMYFEPPYKGYEVPLVGGVAAKL